ncbi:ExbD/TolR family protein [Stappia indica]|uniref:Biopolymer transporter ExbD n=1 Tax=Stappia indica TaxID=538381 RepID=A0A857CFB0_9HYPH|nr:biopolymer transporter ExbD [Stappia indica]QGZ37142.1 biopolymer transporter ExbD [Stappia indica]
MIKVRQAPPKRQAESTISLINIVFLMLIFFLIAGQLAPPVDPDVTLAETTEAPPLAPPDALFADSEGRLSHRGQPVEIAAYLAALGADGPASGLAPGPAPGPVPGEDAGTGGPAVLLAVDRDLDAARMLEIADQLYRAGAGKVSLVTRGAE